MAGSLKESTLEMESIKKMFEAAGGKDAGSAEVKPQSELPKKEATATPGKRGR